MSRTGLAVTVKGNKNRYDYLDHPSGKLPQQSTVEEIRFSCINCGEYIRYRTVPEFYPMTNHPTEYYVKQLKDQYNGILKMVYEKYTIDPNRFREAISRVRPTDMSQDYRNFYYWEIHLASKILDVKVPSVFEIQCPYCRVSANYPFDTSRFHTLDSLEVVENKVKECISEFSKFHKAFIEVMTTSPEFSGNARKVAEKHAQMMQELKESEKPPVDIPE